MTEELDKYFYVKGGVIYNVSIERAGAWDDVIEDWNKLCYSTNSEIKTSAPGQCPAIRDGMFALTKEGLHRLGLFIDGDGIIRELDVISSE